MNAATTADWRVDLEFAARCPGILGVVLAKAESAAQVDATAAALGDFGGGLIALIESATGILEAVSIARSNSLTRLAFGSGDFRHDTAATDDSATVMGARAHLVLASRSAGLPAPIDGPSLAPDVSGLRDYCRRSITTGLGGMLCVKPDHVRTINTEFAPSRRRCAAPGNFSSTAAEASTAATFRACGRPRRCSSGPGRTGSTRPTRRPCR